MRGRYLWLKRAPALVLAALVLLMLLAAYVWRDSFRKPPQTKKPAQQITMVQPLPPPPPEPESKPPEPEVPEQQLEEPPPAAEPEPSPQPDDAPPADTLGLDAEGAAGGDAFGLAARKGGRGLLGGGQGNAIIWYGNQLQRRLEDALQALLADTPAMKTGYSVVLDIWVDKDGRVSRSELAAGSGHADVDQAIRAALPALQAGVGSVPPQDMPQPVRIRLTASSQ